MIYLNKLWQYCHKISAVCAPIISIELLFLIRFIWLVILSLILSTLLPNISGSFSTILMLIAMLLLLVQSLLLLVLKIQYTESFYLLKKPTDLDEIFFHKFIGYMAIFSIILRLVLICFCCFYIYYLINELLIYIARLKTKVAQQRKLIEECDRFIQSLKKK